MSSDKIIVHATIKKLKLDAEWEYGNGNDAEGHILILEDMEPKQAPSIYKGELKLNDKTIEYQELGEFFEDAEKGDDITITLEANGDFWNVTELEQGHEGKASKEPKKKESNKKGKSNYQKKGGYDSSGAETGNLLKLAVECLVASDDNIEEDHDEFVDQVVGWARKLKAASAVIREEIVLGDTGVITAGKTEDEDDDEDPTKSKKKKKKKKTKDEDKSSKKKKSSKKAKSSDDDDDDDDIPF